MFLSCIMRIYLIYISSIIACTSVWWYLTFNFYFNSSDQRISLQWIKSDLKVMNTHAYEMQTLTIVMQTCSFPTPRKLMHIQDIGSNKFNISYYYIRISCCFDNKKFHCIFIHRPKIVLLINFNKIKALNNNWVYWFYTAIIMLGTLWWYYYTVARNLFYSWGQYQ